MPSYLPLNLGFSSTSVISVEDIGSFSFGVVCCGFFPRNCFGNENIAIEDNSIKLPITTGPNHQAPIQRGSPASKPGLVKFTYQRVHTEPTIKPDAGPKIRTPIVIAMYIADCLLATLSSMYGIPKVETAVCPMPELSKLPKNMHKTMTVIFE